MFRKEIVLSKINSSIPILFFLYALSLFTSVAAMELFSSLIVLAFFISVFLKSKGNDFKNQVAGELSFLKDWPYFPIFGFLFFLYVGSLVQSEFTISEKITAWGESRWAFILIALVYFLKDSTWRISKIFNVFLPLLSVVAIYGIIQSFTGIDFVRSGEWPADQSKPIPFWRPRGLFSNTMTYSHILAMIFCFLNGFLISKALKIKGSWLAIIILFLGACALMTNTRGAWVGLSMGVLLPSLNFNKKYILFLILLFCTVFGPLLYKSEKVRNRVVSVFSLQKASNLERIKLWRANYAMAADNPIFGVGYDRNSQEVEKYYDKLGIEDGFVGHAHNSYFQILGGMGFPGFILFLSMIFAFLISSINIANKLSRSGDLMNLGLIIGSIGAQLSFHFGGLTECVFTDAEIAHNFFFFVALALAARKNFAIKE